MARIEGYDNLRQSESAAPSQRASGALTEAQATIGPKQMIAMGKAVESAGDTLAKIEINEAYEASQVRIDDALNQAREEALRLTYDPDEGYTNIKGQDALNRPDGVPLEVEYTGKLKTRMGQIAASLGNDYQRQQFEKKGNDILTTFGGSVLKHEGEEARFYAGSVYDGTARTAAEDIVAHRDNPMLVSENVASLRAAVYKKGKLAGKSAVEIEADMRDIESAAHKTVIDTALAEDDILAADDYLRAHSKGMNASDILDANVKLSQQYDKKVALLAVKDVMSAATPRMNTPAEDRAFNIALGTESNHRQFDEKGNPLTSSAGARGIAQVMPATGPEAAKLAGLDWDPELFNRKRTGDPVKDAEAERYNRALGQAYFNEQLRVFGTLPLAYAAYNAGPGATRAALEKQKTTGKAWLFHLPQETRDYVTKNMKKFQEGGGSYEKPTLAELEAQVREKVGTDNSDRLTTALNELRRQYSITERDKTLADDTSVALAMKEIMANGGDFTALPPQVLAAIPPKDKKMVENFAQKISSGDDTSDLWLYNKLASDPVYLKSLSDAQFARLRADLSQNDFRRFAAERNRLITGKVTDSATELSLDGVSTILNDRLRIMGIDPTPADGSDEAQRVGAIRRYVNESLLVQQANIGKKMNVGEISQAIDQMFATNAVYDQFWGDKRGPMFGMKAGDIPSPLRRKIKERFQVAGIDDPTDGDMLNAYWRLMTRPKAK